VDLLFNNAGIFAPKAFLDHTEEDYDRFLGTILKGKFFMAQAAAKAMKARGGGVIVQTGSMWALQAVGATPSSAYSAANAGVHQMVKNLAIELAPAKIRVNAVAPAVVKTPVYSTFLPPDQVDAALANFNSFHPLGRIGQPLRSCPFNAVSCLRRSFMDHWGGYASGWRCYGRPSLAAVLSEPFCVLVRREPDVRVVLAFPWVIRESCVLPAVMLQI
jgi:NAD(P)-dependent dehydrogenase (short-subunit alcohol dehydrogenase family)